MNPYELYDGIHEYDELPDSVNEIYAEQQNYYDDGKGILR